jgi:hypothetical protein
MESEYPTDEQLSKIELWPTTNMVGLAQYVVEVWQNDFGQATLNPAKTYMRLITGGGSGNEYIIEALSSTLFWQVFWAASYRGGVYAFDGIREFASSTMPLQARKTGKAGFCGTKGIQGKGSSRTNCGTNP